MGFGGLFGGGAISKAQSAVTDFSNQVGIRGGMLAKEAADKEAGALRDQSDYAWKQAIEDADLLRIQIDTYAGHQQEEYASSGVTMQGSPLLMVNQTYKLGQMQIDAELERGRLQTDLLRTQADNTERGGLGSLLQAEGQAAVNTAQTQIQKMQAKQQAMQGILGGAVKGGLGILGGLFH
jgi:hypothetical protein